MRFHIFTIPLQFIGEEGLFLPAGSWGGTNKKISSLQMAKDFFSQLRCEK